MPFSDNDLISAICITKNRPKKLERAIKCFLNQSYRNKELIVVLDKDDHATQQFVAGLKLKRHIHLVVNNGNMKLGDLRNMGIAAANGDYICQWDDDDWYHSQRMEEQLQYLKKFHQDCCILSNWIIFDECSQKAYLSFSRLWEGSILCKKSIFIDNEGYPPLVKAEDTLFIDKLLEHKGKIIPLYAPYLYIYCLHQNNVWIDQQKEKVMKSQELSNDTSELISELLEETVTTEESFLKSENFLGQLRYFHGWNAPDMAEKQKSN